MRTVNNELLVDYVSKGFIHKSEIALFRKIQDVRLRYSLFLNDKYERRLDFLQRKLSKYSINSQQILEQRRTNNVGKTLYSKSID